MIWLFLDLWLWISYMSGIYNQVIGQKFEIKNDKFWKDGQPFQIIGGDLHYFRVHPEVFLFKFCNIICYILFVNLLIKKIFYL